MRKSRLYHASTHRRVFAAGVAVDLTAQSGCPPYEAERVIATNTTAGALNFHHAGKDAAVQQLPIPAASMSPPLDDAVFSVPVGNAVPFIAYWWWDGIVKLNP